MYRFIAWVFALMIGFASSYMAMAEEINILHTFPYTSYSDNDHPDGGAIVSGGKIYGVTSHGGLNGSGYLYGMNIDGTGYQILHSFQQSDGNNPYGSMALIDSTLYGTT
jgi:uncharacterized repeat protein (TIGR03803 family)